MPCRAGPGRAVPQPGPELSLGAHGVGGARPAGVEVPRGTLRSRASALPLARPPFLRSETRRLRPRGCWCEQAGRGSRGSAAAAWHRRARAGRGAPPPLPPGCSGPYCRPAIPRRVARWSLAPGVRAGLAVGELLLGGLSSSSPSLFVPRNREKKKIKKKSVCSQTVSPPARSPA